MHILESFVDVFFVLGSSEHYLATGEYQQNNFGSLHSVDEAGEDLRFVGAELVVVAGEAFKTDGELHIARADNVLDFEVLHVHVEPYFPDGFRVLLRSISTQLLGLGSGADHLAGSEDQGSGLRLSDSHDDSCESLGVVLSVPAVESNFSEVKLAIQICR